MKEFFSLDLPNSLEKFKSLVLIELLGSFSIKKNFEVRKLSRFTKVINNYFFAIIRTKS